MDILFPNIVVILIIIVTILSVFNLEKIQADRNIEWVVKQTFNS